MRFKGYRSCLILMLCMLFNIGITGKSFGFTDATLFVDADSYGTCMWNGTECTHIASANPQNIAATNDVLFGDFGSAGIWQYDGTPNNWTKISLADPEGLAASGSELFGDFGSGGIWQYNGTPNDWTKISPANPENMAAADSDLFGDFGSAGIWQYNGTPNDWIRTDPGNPKNIVAPNILVGD